MKFKSIYSDIPQKIYSVSPGNPIKHAKLFHKFDVLSKDNFRNEIRIFFSFVNRCLLLRVSSYYRQFHTMERIQVPSSAIAHIIGRGGANIKDLQNRSGARCRVQGNYVEV